MPMPKKPRKSCRYCGKEVKRAVDIYCNNKCQVEYQYKTTIEKWLDGEIVFTGVNIPNPIRRYLFEKYNNSCQLCGWSKINPTTGLIPLEVHHIDGNYLNNSLENLQLLCPNCHSLTETNGVLNKGKGRPYTRVYKS